MTKPVDCCRGHSQTASRHVAFASCFFLLLVIGCLCSPGLFARGLPAAAEAELAVADLRAEQKENPVGIDVTTPRLSWKLISPRRGVRQARYQIRLANSAADLSRGRNLIFDSGNVTSEQSILVPYTGSRMQSRRRYYWQVRVADTTGKLSTWSEPAFWEMGLLSPSDWQARWIEPAIDDDPDQSGPSPMLRTEFNLKGKVARARVYATSHGLYELYLNGHRVSDVLFTPGWTAYTHRLQYQTYDVTDLLESGNNAIGAVLGDGWYRGNLGLHHRRMFGDRLGLLAQIEITYADGQVQVVSTTQQWRAATGPVLQSDIYNGEIYDARLEKAGWSTAGYDDHDWKSVTAVPAPTAQLVAQIGPPVRRKDFISAKRIFTAPNGMIVADMGQNMTGWARLRVSGPAGARVTLKHGEELDRDGNLYTDNLRGAKQEVQYVLRGRGVEVFEPHFTFHGFRYVGISGYPGEVTANAIDGVVIHSDMDMTGGFVTSNPLINQLQKNIVWSQRGNFLDVPSDCPQRDERLGWAADAHVFSLTAAFNMNVANFYQKWIGDLSADQAASGSLPWIAPQIYVRNPKLSDSTSGAAGWGDAITIIPWNLYLAYGDERILSTQYEAMTRWVDFMLGRAGEDLIWSGDTQLGDWLDFSSTTTKNLRGSTSHDLIATAYMAHSIDLLQRISTVLGNKRNAEKYGTLFARVAKAFQQKFVTQDGRVTGDTQTSYILALDFDLLPDVLRAAAARRLIDDIRATGHLTTGFLGTPRALQILSRFGYLSEAYGLLFRVDMPSWLYPVNHGATTVWERWDGLKPDGTFQDASMNSFNQYAFGAVGQWMYEVVGGILAAGPGYKRSLIQPQPGGGFTSAAASLETPYGRLGSEWAIKSSRFLLEVKVPANTTSTVRLPHAIRSQVTETGVDPANAAGVSSIRQAGDSVIVDVGAGRYRFEYPYSPSALSNNKDSE